MNLDKQYVCVDVETTGLNSDRDEILEVSARRFKENRQLGKSFYQLCRPRTNVIPEDASRINGIYIEKVAGCPNYLSDGIQQSLAEFMGDRKVIGHNIIEFDLKFLKIQPLEVEDTLVLCRDKYGIGKNSLRKACEREGIKFDPKKAHGSTYDVEKTIELYLKLKNFDSKNEPAQQDIFTSPLPEQPAQQVTMKDIFTQAYSFSRINLYHQCPFKWKKRYIDKIYEPKTDPLITGTVCHKIAERTSVWCYRETFATKFFVSQIPVKPTIIGTVEEYFDCTNPTNKQISYFLFENPKSIETYTGHKGLSYFIQAMDALIGNKEYEKVSMPDLDTYNKIINETLRNEKVIDPDIIRDVEIIMLRFYKSKDFSNQFGQIALVEKQLAFDKDWNYVVDWKSELVFFRGIIDIIEYYPEYVLITDYKTSRTMLTPEQMKRDMQLKIYLLLLYKFLPPNSIKRVIVSIEYLRFGKTVEYEVENIEQMAKEACQWINDSIVDIENELLKDADKAFRPKRNEYCYCCYLGDNNICPFFNKKHINNIDNIESFEVKTKEDCVTAWKRVETNKRENTNLTNKCKTFLKNSDECIMIDEKAKLDNYVKQTREYDAEKVLPLLLKKGIKIKDAIQYFSISESNVEKLLNKNKIETSETEINQVSHLKTQNKFEACTEEEARADEYLNA